MLNREKNGLEINIAGSHLFLKVRRDALTSSVFVPDGSGLYTTDIPS